MTQSLADELAHPLRVVDDLFRRHGDPRSVSSGFGVVEHFSPRFEDPSQLSSIPSLNVSDPAQLPADSLGKTFDIIVTKVA